jgi:Tol biopolymer transport system component
MKQHSRFNQIVVGILFTVALVIGLVIWRVSQFGAQINATYPKTGGEVSAWGRVGISFGQPMRTETINSLFKIEPAVPGQIQWDGNTLWYVPRQPFQPGATYHMTLLPGGYASDGRQVKQKLDDVFTIRQPQILFISSKADQNELWVISQDGGTAHALTSTGGKVDDYSVSLDGEQIAYTVSNPQNGIDLWLMKRDGTQARQLVSCLQDQCSQPAWSPDGKHIVYARAAAGLGNESADSVSGAWIVDVLSGQTDYLFPGSDPSWSPDGLYLADLDVKNGVVRVYDVRAGSGIQMKTASDYAPVWRPDSTHLIYADNQTVDGLPSPFLKQVDLGSKAVSDFLSSDLDQMDFSMPAFSADNQSMVIGLKVMNGGLNSQLWFMGSDGGNKKAITTDQTYSNHSYHWDAAGKWVVFQQFQPEEPQFPPRILLWNRLTGETQVLAENAALPSWLP